MTTILIFLLILLTLLLFIVRYRSGSPLCGIPMIVWLLWVNLENLKVINSGIIESEYRSLLGLIAYASSVVLYYIDIAQGRIRKPFLSEGGIFNKKPTTIQSVVSLVIVISAVPLLSMLLLLYYLQN